MKIRPRPRYYNCGIWEPQIRALNWYLKSTLNKIYTST